MPRVRVEDLFGYFTEHHILTNHEWLSGLESFLNQRSQNKNLSQERIFHMAMEQWLHEDMAVTSMPSNPCLADFTQVKQTLSHSMVVQIVDVINIGSPILGQYNKLTREFVDNSGFEAVHEDEKDDVKYEAKPSRCLLLTISDGVTTLKALEHKPVPALSLLTKPGAKLLLVPGAMCRRGMFMLRRENCQLLGGDVLSLMATRRPVQVMAALLGREVPIPLEPVDEEKMEEGEEENVEPPPPRRPHSRLLLSTSAVTRPIAEVSPVPASSPPRPRPPSAAPLPSPPLTAHTNHQSSDGTKLRVKREAVEVIDLDSPPSSSSKRNSLGQSNNSPKEKKQEEENKEVQAFKALGLVSLLHCQQQRRFIVGSITKSVQAIMRSVSLPLRIVDGMWTMEIVLADETKGSVTCIVDDAVLQELIGLRASEAEEIRVSSDVSRKREGAARISSAQTAMSRLDLVFSLQLFPGKDVSPVIRRIQTIGQAIGCA